MAKTLQYKLKIDTKNSIKSIDQLEDSLEGMETKLKGLAVGSDAFKKLQSRVVAADSNIKNLNKSIEGMDFDQIAGEAGKFAGGVGAIAGAFTILGDAEDETMKEMQENLNKGLGLMMAFKGVIEVATSSGKLFTAVKMAMNSATVANAAATTTDTVATGANTVATGVNTTATVVQTNAQIASNVAFAASPIGMILIAVVALAAAVGILYLATRKGSLEQEIANDVMSETSKLYAEQSAELQTLSFKLQNTAKGSKERTDLIEQMNKEYGKYLPNLLDERSTTEEIAIALDTTNKAMWKKIELDVIKDKLTEVYKKKIEEELELQRKLNGETEGLVENTQDVVLSVLDGLKILEKDTVYKADNFIATKKLSIEEKKLTDMYKGINEELKTLTFNHKENTGSIREEDDVTKKLIQTYEDFYTLQEQPGFETFSEKELKDREDFFTQYNDLGKTQDELEIQNINNKYDLLKEAAELYGKDIKIIKTERDAALAEQQAEMDREEIENLQAKYAIMSNLAASLVQNIDLLFEGGQDAQKEFNKRMILTAFDALSAYAQLTVAKIHILSLGTVQSILTAGGAGFAQAAAMTIGVETALGIARAGLSKFLSAEKGGLIGGRRHAAGGTLIEAEEGEAIINRNSVKAFAPVLSAINQAGGGISLGQSGSIIDYDLLASKLNDKKVYVVSSDMTNQQGIDTKISDRATF